jgi:rSAM/selenodomain-associated transferase 1
VTAIAVFARAPVAGRTKTRLGAAIGYEAAATLAEAFLVDTLSAATAAGAVDVRLHVAGDLDHDALVRIGSRFGIAREAQGQGDLGARMAVAIARGVASHGVALVVGSDAPTLPASTLRLGTSVLVDGAADLVLAPSHDGGYVVIGSSVAPPPQLFADVRWSTRHTLSDTLHGAARAGLRVHLLPPWYDVDTVDDLRLLAAHLAIAPHAAPTTAAVLERLRLAAPSHLSF